MPDGPAYQTGKLHVGDRIQSVNGISFENITHADAVHALNAYDKLLVCTVTIRISQHNPQSTASFPLGHLWADLFLRASPLELIMQYSYCWGAQGSIS